MSSAPAAAASATALELRQVHAVAAGRTILDGISLVVAAGETLAVVGPSGAGKTTLARAAVGLIPVASGSVWVAGRELGRLAPSALRRLRPAMQMIFQDPQRSLDPTQTVAEIVAEGLELQSSAQPWPAWGRRRRACRLAVTAEWLPRVGLDPSLAGRFPAELSGGQRQRVAIARACALRPRLLVADEPVAALDASTGAQILDLLAALQGETGLACLLISHHVAQASRIAHRIAVLGAEGGRGARILEIGDTARLLAAPQHPLTRQLLAAAPPWPLEEPSAVRRQQTANGNGGQGAARV